MRFHLLLWSGSVRPVNWQTQIASWAHSQLLRWEGMMRAGCLWAWDSTFITSSLVGKDLEKLPSLSVSLCVFQSWLLSPHVFRSSPFKVLFLEFTSHHRVTTVFFKIPRRSAYLGKTCSKAATTSTSDLVIQSSMQWAYCSGRQMWMRELRKDQVMHMLWLLQLSTN